MNLQEIRTRLHSFLIESEDLYWLNWIGVQDEIDIKSLYEKYSEILSLNNLTTVQSAMRNSRNPSEKHRLQALYGALTLGFLEYRASAHQQKILKLEAETTVNWDGRDIPLRSFGVKILNEPDRDTRMEMIFKKERAIHEKINPVRIEWTEDLFRSIGDLGYKNYIDLCRETQNRDFHSFYLETERFLDRSEDVFRRSLDRFLVRLTGQHLTGRTHEADLTALFRCSVFDGHFPPGGLIPALKNTISPMGFDLDKIQFDMEDRPKKKPRACVSAVNPPSDVRLTVYPLGGYEDYSGLLHETGHAVHFTHEHPELDFEFKFWGDRGFTEGTAYLFQNITLNMDWLHDIVGMTEPDEFLAFNAFMSILRLRRLIAQFRYQYELFDMASTAGMDRVYKTHMERAHSVQFETGGYLNFDLEFYSAGYVRARLFEVQLRTYCIRTFGQDWWRNSRTGRFLIPLYRKGRKPRADEVARRLGFDGLDMDLYLNTQVLLLNS
ncbi:hypothetical protein JXA40_05450 [bacterium]|nr:hypothetical protein [candidate division CSSED10-310 bacterium]